VVALVFAFLVVLLGGVYLAGYLVAADHLPRNASASGVDIGGMSPKAAETALRVQLGPKADGALKLIAGDTEVEFNPKSQGMTVDYAATVAQAGGGKWSWHPIDILVTLFGGSEQPAVVTWNEEGLRAELAELATSVHTDSHDATLSYKDGKPKVTKGRDAVELDVDATVASVKRSYLQTNVVYSVVESTEPTITTAKAEEALKSLAAPAIADSITVQVGDKGRIIIEPELIAQTLSFPVEGGELKPTFDTEKLMAGLDKELKGLGLKQPKDAKITIGQRDKKPKITPSKDGEGIDDAVLVAKLVETIPKSAGRSVDLDVAVRPAAFTTENAEAMGVKEITGKFTTYFPGSAYRYNNIGKAAKLVNGTFLKPGEKFSMNKTLGERTVANGWMSGGAIDGGKIVERMGGGISQATTTTFNAVFFAGLKDIYHKPHSLYFSRYPVGREATLDWASVDMEFENDSEYGVLMQAWITGKTGSQGSITVRIWSTKTYTIKSSKPVQSNYRAPGATIYDTSKDCVPQSAMSGFDVRFNRLFYKGNELVKTEPFKWSYNSLTPVVCGEKPKKK
jgi:vancomycin resistance protein YoaR